MRITALVLGTFIVLGACKPATDKEVGEKGAFYCELQHFFGNAPLKIGNSYTNSSGEVFTLTTLNYFISNIALERQDGSFYTVPQEESYFLIKLAEGSKPLIQIKDVPVGQYKGVSFILGVDSLRNTMEPARRTGALDVGGRAEGMYWTWNTGYIFFKMEGTADAVPDEQNKIFYFHTGGYGGYTTATINNLRTIKIAFPQENLKISSGKNSILHLKVDAAKVFSTPNTISIASNPNVMFSPFSANIANNCVNMFSLDFVHNG